MADSLANVLSSRSPRSPAVGLLEVPRNSPVTCIPKDIDHSLYSKQRSQLAKYLLKKTEKLY